MILTCPACDTKYVVKDGAIPPAGRQVRCASCKHSWHQDPEPLELAEESGVIEFGGPPEPDPDRPSEGHISEVPDRALAESGIADAPEPPVEVADYADYSEVRDQSGGAADAIDELPPAPAEEPLPVAEDSNAWQEPEPEPEFVGYVERDDEDVRPRRAWPLLLGLVVLVVAAAAAFWFFAPTEWKARAGIAQAGATPLELMITTKDRQLLESGNELVAISGRVINPTDQEQQVPQIKAELRNSATRAMVHSWIIAPPARVLAPRSSASFNSAEVDVPKGGDELTVSLGGTN